MKGNKRERERTRRGNQDMTVLLYSGSHLSNLRTLLRSKENRRQFERGTVQSDDVEILPNFHGTGQRIKSGQNEQ